MASEIAVERYRAECAEKRAKEALRHYLQEAGAPTAGDCGAEIEGIVEDIVEAATARAVARILGMIPETCAAAGRPVVGSGEKKEGGP